VTDQLRPTSSIVLFSLDTASRNWSKGELVAVVALYVLAHDTQLLRILIELVVRLRAVESIVVRCSSVSEVVYRIGLHTCKLT